VDLRPSSPIPKADELEDELFDEFFLWLSVKKPRRADHIRDAKDYFQREGYDLDQLRRLSSIQLERLDIGMGTYGIIQDALSGSEWKKYAKSFVKQRETAAAAAAADNLTASSDENDEDGGDDDELK
jgi:hypothetical protein